MEGYSSDTASESKKDDKDKKVGKTAGLGSRTFEFAKKTDAAEKIGSGFIDFDKLLPKDGKAKEDKSAEVSSLSLPDTKVEKTVENTAEEAEEAEEAEDAAIETLSEGEKAEVAKDYAQEKRAGLEAGRNDAEDPAEAAVREANIEYLEQVEEESEAVPSERGEEASESTEVAPEADLEANAEENHAEELSEFTHDEAIDLNASERDVTDEDVPATPVSPPTPPIPPTPGAGAPNQPPTPRGRPTGNPFGGGSGASFNAMPQASSPNTAPATVENHYYQSNEGSYFLAGGILGYMLGRRRGRIKTEKRMKAVTKKLEKQIKDTREKVQLQEQVVRENARRRYNETHVPQGAETTVARVLDQRAPETITEHTEAARKLSPSEVAAGERVQHMDHAEILAIAEKVTIDGTSLRKIYEAKQITEPGLRRLTREYLRGGDLKAALKHELQVKEMQYERDPQMRDRLAASYAGVEAAGAHSSQEAMASLLASGPKPKTETMQSSVEQAQDEAEQSKRRGHQVLVGAWATLMVVMVIIIVILATRQR
jgi:hypothetical protein